MSKHL